MPRSSRPRRSALTASRKATSSPMPSALRDSERQHSVGLPQSFALGLRSVADVVGSHGIAPAADVDGEQHEERPRARGRGRPPAPMAIRLRFMPPLLVRAAGPAVPRSARAGQAGRTAAHRARATRSARRSRRHSRTAAPRRRLRQRREGLRPEQPLVQAQPVTRSGDRDDAHVDRACAGGPAPSASSPERPRAPSRGRDEHDEPVVDLVPLERVARELERSRDPRPRPCTCSTTG